VSATGRREELKELLMAARQCTRCAELAATRTSVVFGAGNADSELMFVGEAPGANEDLQGLPFVGAAGKLLEKLLGEIGLSRAEVFIANVLKCRPPGNRDPQSGEIENCRPYLVRQVELIEPRVICTLGNFATKLLRGDPAGITRVHGVPEVRTIGEHTARIYPLFHPAAALYTPSTLETLREDFARLPAVLALAPPPAAARTEPTPDREDLAPTPPTPEPPGRGKPETQQLELF
jgi:uracil-DNA glycosylase